MDCTTEFIEYKDTGYFSSLMMDYLNEEAKLSSFYQYSPIQPDYKEIIANRKEKPVNRSILLRELKDLYAPIPQDKKVAQNIEALAEETTFTVCTAHQPNIFTGYLYFIYKILHTVKLAADLKQKYPQYHFVPVYYMGSEDNDLEELGTFNLYGKRYQWETKQTGAVGRMKNKGIEPLINTVAEELGQNEFAREIITLLKTAYLQNKDIQTATLSLVNALFGRFGLVVVNADRSGFKRAVLPMMEEELIAQNSVKIVNKTKEKLTQYYHAQANPRDINLFYLTDQWRERIVQEGQRWKVLNTNLSFSKQEITEELNNHPERFSPNVILRGVLQESILPNVAFIGGGGELAYWLELKDLFHHFDVPFPLLLLRHSVLWADEKSLKRLAKVNVKVKTLFTDTEVILKDFVKNNTAENLKLTGEKQEIEEFFKTIQDKAINIDKTLEASVAAEKVKTLRSIEKIEKKILRAEKKKFSWQTDLIRNTKEQLFPHNGLQEREDNLLPFYAAYGSEFIDMVYSCLKLNSKFTIIKVNS